MTRESDFPSRRAAFAASVGLAAGAALLLPSCAKREEEEVSATEDLMREHGVLRRILVIYRETAAMLHTHPASLDAGALGQAAELFRTFGEDYHERRLEEGYIFPALKKQGGPISVLVDTLLAQHNRGREATAYVKARCASGKIATADAEPLADALEDFARMYEAHTAFEDTIAFQTWKTSMSRHELAEMGEKFEDIEHDQFKGDGFDIALDQIAGIEQRLGLNDLARYTAKPVA
jgi:hemerythrin-like domain-containing protein